MEYNINNIENKSNIGVNQRPKKKRQVIKTYRDFAVNALENKPTSLANMIIQEKKKRDSRYGKSVKNPKNIFVIVLSTILILLGIGAIAAIIISIDKENENKNDKKFSSDVVSTLEFDYKKIVELDGFDSVKDAAEDLYDNTNLPFGAIKNIFFTKKDKMGYSEQVGAKVFLEELDSRAPNQFIRNLENRFSAGIVSLNENKPFLILETVNFDASYSNLLAWEKTMLYDMGSLFRVNQKYYATPFSDIILYNKDVRAILDSEGSLVFAYSFVESHKILIFTDNQVLKIIIDDLRNLIKK